MSNDFYIPSGWPPSAGRVIVSKSGLKSELDLISNGFTLVEEYINNIIENGMPSTRPGHTYTANDWCWLDEPGGLIFQWVSGITLSTAGVTVTLPTTFPHAFFNAWGSINAGDSASLANNGWIGHMILNTSQVRSFSAMGAPSVNLCAIGR